MVKSQSTRVLMSLDSSLVDDAVSSVSNFHVVTLHSTIAATFNWAELVLHQTTKLSYANLAPDDKKCCYIWTFRREAFNNVDVSPSKVHVIYLFAHGDIYYSINEVWRHRRLQSSLSQCFGSVQVCQ